MGFQQRSLFTNEDFELYCNLVNFCPDHIQVLTKVKFTEFITPTEEYGTDEFYKLFMALSKETAPFVLYDAKSKKVSAVIELQNDGRSFASDETVTWLKFSEIEFVSLADLASLYTDEVLSDVLGKS
ncbi:DUF2726 domain-containing protein [Pantoea endophytica]|uniref:DUF2726 domain-containing protein n=1 Tax=Pantoea sp. BJ2 TaxID=3141322 RepID=A0AAU7U448_9GAMM